MKGVLPWFAPHQSKLLATIPSMTLTVSILISSCDLAFVCIDDSTGTISRKSNIRTSKIMQIIWGNNYNMPFDLSMSHL